MIRQIFALALLVSGLWAERTTERIPTRFVEQGQPVTLEAVIFKPDGAGPFPAVIFNHGSTGDGDQPSLFTRTWTSASIADFFTARGWMAVFPQRRGRGQSGGVYDEGFEGDRSRYTCDPRRSLAGMERALQDLDAAVAYVKARKDVDPRRLLLGGQSRGGILSVVYAGSRREPFLGVLNFVGGWMSDGCPEVRSINTVSFRRGAAFGGPTLWLYGENDPFYGMRHSRENFEAFRAAGGHGEFVPFALPGGVNGHHVLAHPQVWSAAVERFLRGLPRVE